MHGTLQASSSELATRPARGASVAVRRSAAAGRAKGLQTLVPLIVDVADGASRAAAVARLEQELAARGDLPLIALVNNAGIARGLPLEVEPEAVTRDVFDAYTDPEEYTFDKTVVPLRLAQYEGEKLVSRSQAKRVAHRFERFKRVELDFAGVSDIGQAFADELFRVFATAHPTIRITPINTEPAVAQMIRRAVAAGVARADSSNHS